MEKVDISTAWIKLDQLLKYANVAESGGVAKLLIQNGCIFVNDVLCLERGKKIKIGDRVKINLTEAFVSNPQVLEFTVVEKV